MQSSREVHDELGFEPMELLIATISVILVTDSQIRDTMGLVDVPESGNGDRDAHNYLMSLTLSLIARCLFWMRNSWLVMLWIYAVFNFMLPNSGLFFLREMASTRPVRLCLLRNFQTVL